VKPHDRMITTAAGITIVAVLIAAPGTAAEWYVLCDRSTDQLKVDRTPDGPGLELVAGPFPGVRTAGMWVQDHHPDGRCPPAAPQPSPPLPTETPVVTSEGPWVALCTRATGSVELIRGSRPAGTMVLWGDRIAPSLFAERSVASSWVSSVCPSWRCDASGRCVQGLPPRPPTPIPARWVAADLSSTVHPLSQAVETPASAVAGPTTVLGPGGADLRPLIDTAIAAAKGCAYPTALASADHLTNFDPVHPWLVANHSTLQDLAARQQATERSTWQASASLRAGELKRARELAERAADTAVSCQARAVSALLDGIDTAIEQNRAARNAARSRAASAMLPALVDLAGMISGAQAGTVQFDGAAATEIATSLMPTALDLCAFQLEYRDPSSLVPICTCSGYNYDATQFRCVR